MTPSLTGRNVATDPRQADDLDPEIAGFPLFRGMQPIAGYRVVRTLAQGPTGTIFEVEASDKVRYALKLAVSALDARLVAARFQSERPALSRTDHPSIVKVHDAGVTAEGQAFFVSDLVQGRPITEYCNTERLTLRDRLHLFLRLCDALLHAHPMGIVHCGLRPSNVLIATEDGEPVVRVTDFGMVKATARGLTEMILHDAQGDPARTPEYASPEQATPTPSVDRRADIYSLGALLYELLCGVPPFDPQALRRLGLARAREEVRARRPDPPSRRDRRIPRELDRIVMKALEKEPQLRHQTAEALSADVAAFLEGRGVVRAGVRLGRHAALLPAILIVSVGVVGAGFGLLSLFRDGGTPARQLEPEFTAPLITSLEQATRPVHPFSVNDSHPAQAEQPAALSPIEPGPAEPAAVEPTAPQLEPAAGEPQPIESRAAQTEPAAVRAPAENEALRASQEPRPPMTPAEPRADDPRPVNAGPSVPLTAPTAADPAASRRDESGLRATLQARRIRLGIAHPDTVQSQRDLAGLLTLQGRHGEAEPLLAEALAGVKRNHPGLHIETGRALKAYGECLIELGQLHEAENVLLPAHSVFANLLGPAHRETVETVRMLVDLYERSVAPRVAAAWRSRLSPDSDD